MSGKALCSTAAGITEQPVSKSAAANSHRWIGFIWPPRPHIDCESLFCQVMAKSKAVWGQWQLRITAKFLLSAFAAQN
jgi:hypothetical protein